MRITWDFGRLYQVWVLNDLFRLKDQAGFNVDRSAEITESTGIITPDQYTWEQFITQHALEIVDETTIRAEWGNGEGYDTFTVQFNNF